MRRTHASSTASRGATLPPLLLAPAVAVVIVLAAPVVRASDGDSSRKENRGDDLSSALPGSAAPTPSELVLIPAFPGARALQLRFESDLVPAAPLADGGEVSVYRPGLRLRAALPLIERLTLQLVARYGASFYEFDGAHDFFDLGPRSADPYDDLHDAGLSLQGAFAFDDGGHLLFEGERWSLLGELFGAARWEDGAFDDGLLGGGALAVGYELPRRLQLAVGVSVRTQIAESGVGIDPVFSARWRVTKDLTLRTRGRGGQIEYAWSRRLMTYATAFRTAQSWRLGRRRGVPGRTLLSDDQVRCGLGLEWRALRQLRVQLEAGAIARRRLEVDVRGGGDSLSEIDGDPSGYLALSFELRP